MSKKRAAMRLVINQKHNLDMANNTTQIASMPEQDYIIIEMVCLWINGTLRASATTTQFECVCETFDLSRSGHFI